MWDIQSSSRTGLRAAGAKPWGRVFWMETQGDSGGLKQPWKMWSAVEVSLWQLLGRICAGLCKGCDLCLSSGSSLSCPHLPSCLPRASFPAPWSPAS